MKHKNKYTGTIQTLWWCSVNIHLNLVKEAALYQMLLDIENCVFIPVLQVNVEGRVVEGHGTALHIEEWLWLIPVRHLKAACE